MAKVITQNIPPALVGPYDSSLQRATLWKAGGDIYQVRKRVPFRIGHVQDYPVGAPSMAQIRVREAFRRCVGCFRNQPETGGVVPPGIGPRARTWWYSDAVGSGLWYYDYFISQTWSGYYSGIIPDWCWLVNGEWNNVNSWEPDAHNYEPDEMGCGVRGDVPGALEANSMQRAYLQTPHAGGSAYVAIFLTGLYLRNASSRSIGLYAVDPSSYDPWLLTWNNQPGPGELISTFYPRLPSAAGWYYIPINWAQAICIKYVDESIPVGDSLSFITMTTPSDAWWGTTDIRVHWG